MAAGVHTSLLRPPLLCQDFGLLMLPRSAYGRASIHSSADEADQCIAPTLARGVIVFDPWRGYRFLKSSNFSTAAHVPQARRRFSLLRENARVRAEPREPSRPTSLTPALFRGRGGHILAPMPYGKRRALTGPCKTLLHTLGLFLGCCWLYKGRTRAYLAWPCHAVNKWPMCARLRIVCGRGHRSDDSGRKRPCIIGER
jgi:hypothetical protein